MKHILILSLLFPFSLMAMEKETPTTNNDQSHQRDDSFLKALGIDTNEILKKSLTDIITNATQLPESAVKTSLLERLHADLSSLPQPNKK